MTFSNNYLTIPRKLVNIFWIRKSSKFMKDILAYNIIEKVRRPPQSVGSRNQVPRHIVQILHLSGTFQLNTRRGVVELLKVCIFLYKMSVRHKNINMTVRHNLLSIYGSQAQIQFVEPWVRTLISWTRGAKAGSSGPVNPTETVKRMAVVSLDMPIGFAPWVK